MCKHTQPKEGKAPTLHDVARHARVSTATVSRFINSPESVSEARRARVRKAVQSLGYVPHAGARAMVTRRSHTMGVVVPTVRNSIFAAFIEEMEGALAEHSYALLVANSRCDPELEHRQVRVLLERGVDAIALVGAARQASTYEDLERKGVPYILTWCHDHDSPHACVGFGNWDASYRVASHLLDLGHRHFALISGLVAGNDRAEERLEGALAALGARDDVRITSVSQVPYGIAHGGEAVRRAMQEDPRPTAVICGNDQLASGALFECLRMGLSVPEEVSIAGFDDMELARHAIPALTTVAVPALEMGRRAATRLLEMLDGVETIPRDLLEAPLVIRDTTGPRLAADEASALQRATD